MEFLNYPIGCIMYGTYISSYLFSDEELIFFSRRLGMDNEKDEFNLDL